MNEEDLINSNYANEIDDVEVEINDVSNNDNNKNIDDELNIYNLEDYQKDLIKEGQYDPWDFEEEDLEEDDYFEEDY